MRYHQGRESTLPVPENELSSFVKDANMKLGRRIVSIKRWEGHEGVLLVRFVSDIDSDLHPQEVRVDSAGNYSILPSSGDLSRSDKQTTPNSSPKQSTPP